MKQYLEKLQAKQTFYKNTVGNAKVAKSGHVYAKVKFGDFTKEAYDDWRFSWRQAAEQQRGGPLGEPVLSLSCCMRPVRPPVRTRGRCRRHHRVRLCCERPSPVLVVALRPTSRRPCASATRTCRSSLGLRRVARPAAAHRRDDGGDGDPSTIDAPH